ncbi:hypothetical protein PRIPAC_75826 [Pristionchus pacificus]|uniref:Uncharacterized protein n=1 Tax=Pristionchus pacificus TaxID=54126 RepID=A0A2A6CGB7_PRIPA|nr:hypothetical protein PRIPAC_75826 [Pristionchus pacificus]|eukprot:PDM77103.1 hypothetical protein PRIPAC_43015 [Pristionchus pacificus]
MKKKFSAIMPMIHLATNVDVPADFEARFLLFWRHKCQNVRLTDIMAVALNKPRETILVQVTAYARMIHAATPGPCAHVWLKSMGHLDGHSNNIYAEKITTLINEMTGVPKNKTVIEFYDLHGDNIGFNGATVTSNERKSQK